MATKIQSVVSALAFEIKSPAFASRLWISAEGIVPTSGWSAPTLSPHYDPPPKNGRWEFDFVADEPSGVVLNTALPIFAFDIFVPFGSVNSIRINSTTNHIDVQVDRSKAVAQAKPQYAGNYVKQQQRDFHWEQEIAVYDDSFNIIGFCNGFGRLKMKKLRHDLYLVVNGPDETKIRSCFEQAAGAGLIAAIVAVFVTGGAALEAAIGAFLGQFTKCLGAGFSVRFEHRDHWIEWCT